MPLRSSGAAPPGRSAGGARSGAPRDTDHEEPAVPPIRRDTDPVGTESPAPRVMPSFDSLRGPRRRSAVDLLVPGQPRVPEPPAPEQTAPPRPAAPRRPATPRPPAAPRPAEWGDLLHLGV